MIIPHIRETFVSGGIIYPGRRIQNKEATEEIWGNMQVNAISKRKTEGENWDGIRPYEPGSVLNNWTAEEIPVAFRIYSESPNINDVSNATNDSGYPFEQDRVMEDFQDSEDDQGCELSPELLRMVEHEEKQILPHQESVETVNLGDGQEEKEVKIGTGITAETRRNLIELLQEFKDVFAWSYQDMPGQSTDIVVHRLPIKEEYKPVQQKLRRMRPDVLLKIKEEVKKQFDAGFLQMVKYSEWVANIVLVPKKDGKVRMCVDYRDLNKASPKDNFPLPHIDTLVDNTAGHSFFSFMDGFSGYNQIKMHPEDMDRTTFITLWGTFCYKVMPFGLKNAGATYQRAMVTLFHDMMHREIEVYVDDMIAKSRTEKEHVQVLKKLFLRLRKFQLKPNPAKCTFGARSGKLLGFIVSEKGIEVDPNKIKAIQELPPPRTQKEVRGFLGRLNYIARFISQLTERCDPIFRLLRKHNPGVWNEECQETFDKIK
ncbi:RNA-directed DNA polymerase (Reverse transcriptase), Ribonuclease H-like protein [Gossypium australe]|uniref:RNA-directed DNA polymerase (Reverse transcriptase), Ribonuclease H-like protein n=1 Tax=Gossypium australe TaxID=47621 RepID=A0A5B6WWS8_9ROSI|nr:RNA-directed DNA polymerase (Reverse transcriptase), Ribonuclease H-like protein [Gossypium australe]